MIKHHPLTALAIALAGCSSTEAPIDRPATPPLVNMTDRPKPIAPYRGDHPIDRLIHPLLAKHELPLQLAGNAELCRRLIADLAGYLPSTADIERECAGRTAAEIIDRLQKHPRYLLVSERHWRDRFDTDDIVVDWRYLKDLFALVRDLHQGGLRYDHFTEKVLAHPGFVLTQFLPDEMARHAFRSFLGREATDAEAADLAALYRMWVPGQDADPDFPYLQTLRAYLVPQYCGPLGRCRAELFGGAEVSFSGLRFGDYFRWEDLEEVDRQVLGEVGRLFARQPFFWEAAADEILNRYLGWSDGGRFPREVGVVLPEVRQVVADHLRLTGDYPGTEKLVLTSWLYRQSARIEPDGHGDDPLAPEPPVWSAGPVKAANAETWIDSLAPMTFIDIGTCDPRYPDYYPYFLMYDAQMRGVISEEQLAQDLALLHMLQENRGYFGPGQNGYSEPYYIYTYYARLLGGCPGFQSKRQAPAGLAFGFQQETFAELVCAEEVAQNSDPKISPFDVRDVYAHQVRMLFGREPEKEELRAVLEHYSNCTGADCTEKGIARSICTALAGSGEMLFY